MTPPSPKEEKTTVKFFAKDECYCDWYRCQNCENIMITENSNYCPNCGLKIDKPNQEPL